MAVIPHLQEQRIITLVTLTGKWRRLNKGVSAQLAFQATIRLLMQQHVHLLRIGGICLQPAVFYN